MSNDAKLGLVLGVAIVLLIGLVFFRNDTLAARMPADATRPARVQKGGLRGTPQAHIAPVATDQ